MKNDSNSLAASAGLRAALGYYRLIAEIGRGGMASVFLALFPNGDGTSRKVVLKQLHPELAMDDDFRAMFEDEARLATRFHHENVVEAFDIYSDADVCVLVMEFLDGQTLSRIRQRAHRVNNVPLSVQLRILSEVLAGIDYVHALNDEDGRPLGIVHRDVTPSNVFVTYDGRVKVVDFGIAKASTRVAETRMGVLKGKLAYMSPEAVRGEPVDRRTDIFSVGVMLWEAACGVRMWSDHDDVAVYRRLASGDLPIQPPNGAAVHPELLRIAQRALAADPYDRYGSASVMRDDIENLLVSLGKVTRAPTLAAYMESFFAVDREKLQTLVDEALEQFPTRPISQHRLRANELSASYPALDASEPPTTVSTPNGATFRTAAYDVQVADVPEVRPRRHPLAIAATVAAAAMGVAFVAHSPSNRQTGWLGAPLHRSSAGTTAEYGAPAELLAAAAPAISDSKLVLPPVASVSSSNPSPAAEPPPTVERVGSNGSAPQSAQGLPRAPVAAQAARPQITVVFSARPSEARFHLDGEALEGNPVTLRRSADDKHHRVRIEAPGYTTVWRPIDLDRDLSREFELVRSVPSLAGSARGACPGVPREDPQKTRRSRNAVEQEDPWSL